MSNSFVTFPFSLGEVFKHLKTGGEVRLCSLREPPRDPLHSSPQILGWFLIAHQPYWDYIHNPSLNYVQRTPPPGGVYSVSQAPSAKVEWESAENTTRSLASLRLCMVRVFTSSKRENHSLHPEVWICGPLLSLELWDGDLGRVKWIKAVSMWWPFQVHYHLPVVGGGVRAVVSSMSGEGKDFDWLKVSVPLPQQPNGEDSL